MPNPAAVAQGPEENEAAAAGMVARLIALGSKLVLLRRGPDGVMVAHGPRGEAYSVRERGRTACMTWLGWVGTSCLATGRSWQWQRHPHGAMRGASCCALVRAVHAGSHLANVPPALLVQVPSFAGTKVQDVVGCGNACCGAFLVGLGPNGLCPFLRSGPCYAGGRCMTCRSMPLRAALLSAFCAARRRRRRRRHCCCCCCRCCCCCCCCCCSHGADPASRPAPVPTRLLTRLRARPPQPQAAYTQGHDLAESAAWGCAAGSIMAEHKGVPQPPACEFWEEAARRQAAVLRAARRVRLPVSAARGGVAGAAAGARRGRTVAGSGVRRLVAL